MQDIHGKKIPQHRYTWQFRDIHGIIGDIHGTNKIYMAFPKIYTANYRYTWHNSVAHKIYMA